MGPLVAPLGIILLTLPLALNKSSNSLNQQLTIPLSENETLTTMSEPSLKQSLLNTVRDGGHWPDPYLGSPEYGTKLP